MQKELFVSRKLIEKIKRKIIETGYRSDCEKTVVRLTGERGLVQTVGKKRETELGM